MTLVTPPSAASSLVTAWTQCSQVMPLTWYVVVAVAWFMVRLSLSPNMVTARSRRAERFGRAVGGPLRCSGALGRRRILAFR